ncbi:hypothetical protein KIPB_013341, partial [Kipferlia bialata]|eukprot:g13341.t1
MPPRRRAPRSVIHGTRPVREERETGDRVVRLHEDMSVSVWHKEPETGKMTLRAYYPPLTDFGEFEGYGWVSVTKVEMTLEQ